MSRWKHDRPKPVIGIAGGIGAGKSAISRLFGSQGCAVIDSDTLSHQVLQTPEVQEEIRAWLGPGVFRTDGSISRSAVAARVFSDPAQMARLNALIHPRVARLRDALMGQHLADPAVKAVVWDTPLLFEAGLNHECDVIVFIDLSRPERLARLQKRGVWSPQELDRREKLQFPLDKKASLADYCIDNSGDEASSLRQVQQVLSQILASKQPPGTFPSNPH